MDDVQAINKIEELVKNGMTVEADGRQYTAVNLTPVIFNPKPKTLTVYNLRGFCQFINNDIDKAIRGKPHLIIVNSYESVDLISAYDEEEKKRTSLISATISSELIKYPFGRFFSQEEFAIMFRSLFVKKENDDFDYVLEYASKLTGGTQIDTQDDGITQKVGVKRGVSGALKGTEELKAIVNLSPYRTFREIEQPEGEFLLRVRLDSNEQPTVALFEADGGAWTIKAMNSIVEFIKKLVTGIEVIA
ncbi:MAG: hypothetical protein FWB73_00065 [Treponema sp.]|nr:hypothetical protein [Treponema sp.]